MKNGIYKVNFDSNQNDYGNGIISVNNGSINGGDYVCYYQGVILGSGVDLRVVRYNKQATTVFGTLDKIDLNIMLKDSLEQITFSGSVKGHPHLKLTGNMTFLDELV